MALGPVIFFTAEELDQIKEVEKEIDSEIERCYTGGSFSVAVKQLNQKCQDKLCAIYREAGWEKAYFAFGSFRLTPSV